MSVGKMMCVHYSPGELCGTGLGSFLVSWWRAIDILDDGANRSHLARGYFLFLFSLMSTAQERISRVTDRFMTHWFNFKERRLCSLSNLKLITLLGNFLVPWALSFPRSQANPRVTHILGEIMMKVLPSPRNHSHRPFSPFSLLPVLRGTWRSFIRIPSSA
jgi:hypothetical protein